MPVYRRMAALAAAAALLAGCALTTPGAAPAGPTDPASVAGLAITTGASGPKPGVRDAAVPVAGTNGGAIDKLAANAVADIQTFWDQAAPTSFDLRFQPIRRLVSYDSNGPGVSICGSSTAGLVNAFYCPQGDIVAWDRGELLPMLDDSFGSISVVAVLAHEFGHVVQSRLATGEAAPSIVAEQQADCYAGAYFRWVAEGKSERFQVSTGPGLNQILATLFFIRDSTGTGFDAQGAHGNAFDRVSAFQFGFGEGPARCAKIDADEVRSRSTQLEFGPNDRDTGLGKGNLKVNDQQALGQLTDSLRMAFRQSGAQPPSITANRTRCADAAPTSPASYCPGTNTVALNLTELVKIGTAPRRGHKGGIGDFAAFAEIASRYVLSVQRSAELPIEGAVAAQRTACLTGAWAATITAGTRAPLQLSPGDLDEAVAEMLAPQSLIAADVNGRGVPSGFARVAAFRDGFSLGGIDTCVTKYPSSRQ